MRAPVEVSSQKGFYPVWEMGVCAGRVYVGNEGLEDDSELVESQQVGQVGHLLTSTENSPG